MNFLFSFSLAAVFFVAGFLPANAHEYKQGNLLIEHPVIPATVKVAPVAAGYLRIVNSGDEDDRLISISAEFSQKQEIHTMKVIDGVMRMRPVENGVVIPAKGEAVLKRGGDHLMFIKLAEPMEAGQLRDVTLTFEKAGDISIGMIVVDPVDLEEDEANHSNHSNQSGHSGHNH